MFALKLFCLTIISEKTLNFVTFDSILQILIFTKMKKTLLYLILIAAISSHAIGQTLVGIKSATGSVQLVRYNLQSDVLLDSFPIPNWSGVILNTSTYDAQTSNYIFNTPNRGIVSMNALTGSSRVLANNTLIESQYDQSDGHLHGLYRSASADNNMTLQSFDGLSATPIRTTTLPNIDGIVVGSSAFNSNLHEYIFVGTKNNTGSLSNKLYFVNVRTGVIRRSLPIDFSLIGMQFDNVNNQYVGIHRANGASQSSFAKIDTNGTITSLRQLNNIMGFQMGTSTLCQTEQAYIHAIIDSDGMSKILSISLADGSETRRIWQKNRGNFSEIECDNTQFAYANYGQIVRTNVSNVGNLLGKVYPNPSSDGQINVEIPPQNKGYSMQLFNQLGQLVVNKTVDGHQTQLNIHQSGIYLLKLATDNKATTMKIVVQF
jgi:hypothetical protein